MKSLRSTGIDTAARTASRSSSEPLKRRCSVSTLMIRAPPSSYAPASFAGSEIVASSPRDGLARFTSAMTPMPGSRSAAITSSGDGAALACCLDLGEADDGLASGNVGTDSLDDGVEHGRRTHKPSIPFRLPARCRMIFIEG